MSEWQPIATVPKDGSRILALTDYGKMCVMYWNDEKLVRETTCRRCDGMGLGSLTHWHALPEPPEGE